MIKYQNMLLAFLCLLLFSVCVIAGFFLRPLFILAIIALLGYIWTDKKHLRCPRCGGFENLERLFYAKSHVYHCRHCGQIIKIETKRSF